MWLFYYSIPERNDNAADIQCNLEKYNAMKMKYCVSDINNEMIMIMSSMKYNTNNYYY